MAALRTAQTCRYLVYSEADFEVFPPQGRQTLHRWGWNSAWRSPPPCHISPHRCNDKGVGPKNWNFYSDLTEIWNINAPQGRIPCTIFTKFREFVPHFRMCWVLKFGWILLKGLWSYGGFKLRGHGCPQIFSAPKRQNYASDHQTFSRWKNVPKFGPHRHQ